MKIKENKFFLCLLLVLAVLGGLLAFYFPARSPQALPLISFSGVTMGTTYEVQLAGEPLDDATVAELKKVVDAELLAVNRAMSTYMPESEISIFNRLDAWDPLAVSLRFREVLVRSFDVFRQTNGAFDPTLGPLIDLWGFGAKGKMPKAPSESEIEKVMQHVGLDLINLSENGLVKGEKGVEINLSAIAKGYGVDRVAALLKREGYENIYVEIGGELFCSGVNASSIPWRIGIQVPKPESAEAALQILSLNNSALATSGDYRNYAVTAEGFRHHILDPRTGRPATHTLTSVSVLASDCMTADALATALFVMGTEDGLKWVEAHEGIEALFIDRDGEEYKITATPGFESTLIAVP